MLCPRCQGFASSEPGGLRCLVCGATYLYRRVLPRDHPLSGSDYANRARQRALDTMLMHPGRAVEIIFDLLERLDTLRHDTKRSTPAM